MGTQNVAAQRALMFRDFAEQSSSETRAVPLDFYLSLTIGTVEQNSRLVVEPSGRQHVTYVLGSLRTLVLQPTISSD
jgi:hypothetical protein